jgi:hypothetical protein
MRAFLLSASPLNVPGAQKEAPDPELLYRGAQLASWYLTVEGLEKMTNAVVFAHEGATLSDRLTLTQTVREALASAPDDTLVLIDSGPVLHDKASFSDQAEDAAEDDPPIFLWVAFELKENGDGTRQLLTHGATKLGSPMEIEVDKSQRSVEDLLERAADAVLVAMAAGGDISDGDTIELSEDRVRVRIQPSLSGSGERAFRLRLP